MDGLMMPARIYTCPADIGFHPFADLFPLIDGDEFAELVADIAINGVHDPVLMLNGQILDGRNRYRAACELHRNNNNVEIIFHNYNQQKNGDPLSYVISKNLRRRHLTESQRAYVAAKLATARQGERTDLKPSANLPKVDQAKAAGMLKVSERLVRSARAVQEHGIAELNQAVSSGRLAASKAEQIARLPEHEQQQIVAQLPRGERAIMAARREPDDSLDFFPTPPWATRALMEVVLPHMGVEYDLATIWEPACGEGHMAEILSEYGNTIFATDVFDYGYSRHWHGPGITHDFLGTIRTDLKPDWIITNPPFNDKSEKFVLRALELAKVGVAMFVRLQWLETVGRYEAVFRDFPPTLIAFFAERVNLCKGRWEPDGTTATAYVWLVWKKGEAPQAPLWIPPGQRQALTKETDRKRFTAHPVLPMENA